MSIIIISSDSMEAERDIAQKVADALDYQLIDRSILPEIAAAHELEAGKIEEALEKGPSRLRRMPQSRWDYILSCIEAEVLDRIGRDNTVCCGLAAHLYVLGVSHALRVRILTGHEDKKKKLIDQGVSEQAAEKMLAKQVQDQRRWSSAAFNLDETDPALYDLVINLGQIDPGEAVSTITGAVEYRRFKPMTYSRKCLTNRALAAKVKSVLLKDMSDIRVKARDGTVVVTTKALKREKRKKTARIKELAGPIDGVGTVEVHLIKDIFGEAAESFR